MSRPRILYILSSLAANDLGDEIVSILARLSRSEFEPGVVVLGGKEELAGRIAELKVETHLLGMAGPVGVWRAISRVRRILKREAPAVIHGFGSWGGSVAQLAAPPDVAVVRSVTRPPNHEKDFTGRILQLMERRARRKVHTRYVVPNVGSRGLALRAYGAVEGHVVVLPRSVDVGAVRDRVKRTSRNDARALMGLRAGETAVAFVSDFDSGARMDQILTSFQLAVRELPTLRLFMVGSGRYEGSTRWKAEELQLSDSVVFLGRGTEAGPIWAAADLTVDASPWAGWSRSALISIAAGVATVKRQEGVGGWSEEVGETLPMISGTAERFAEDLIRLANDPAVREEIHRQEATVVDDVDASNVAAELAGLYRSLCD